MSMYIAGTLIHILVLLFASQLRHSCVFLVLRDFIFRRTQVTCLLQPGRYSFSFSLLSVQFGDELASPGKVLWIHITVFASWNRPSVQLRDINTGGTARL